ncbi:MAG: hypothetical protein KF726_23470 [Anaerolineae bacterium]|nr:hypothetical protein [Anaerolineae bacterium]
MRILRFGLVLLVGMLVGFAGALDSHQRIRAAETGSQTFLVQAGAFAIGNMEISAFMPAKLKVHQGDTVTWLINGLNDIHFQNTINPPQYVIAPVVDGKPLPQFNPAFAAPSLASGSTYTGGESSSGLVTAANAYMPKTYSLVIGAPVGKYTYVAHLKSGMMGTIEVVPDDEAIPSPTEAALIGAQEYTGYVTKTLETLQPLMENQPVGEADEQGKITIMASMGSTSLVQEFFPAVAVIHTGDTVTWTNPEVSVDGQTVASLKFDGDGLVLVPPTGAAPMVTLGSDYNAVIESGGKVGVNDVFNSGILLPGQSYTLTFTEAGVYPYYSSFHYGMKGVIVVLPAE